MAHLDKLPTIFVKDGEKMEAFYTVQARELIEAGWVEEGTKKSKLFPQTKPEKQPEIVVEAGVDAFDMDAYRIAFNEAIDATVEADEQNVEVEEEKPKRNYRRRTKE